MKVKTELKMSSPLSIISTVSKLEKDSLQLTCEFWTPWLLFRSISRYLLWKGELIPWCVVTCKYLSLSAQLEKYKSEKGALSAELSELRATQAELEARSSTDSERCAEMKKKLSYSEVKAAEYRLVTCISSSSFTGLLYIQ